MPAERQVWACSHVGRVRAVNEDGCLIGQWRSRGAIAQWAGTLPAGKGWAVIADGMGGHDAGEVASRVVLDTFQDLILGATSRSDIAQLLEAANLNLFEAMYSHEGRPGMGATVVGLLLLGPTAVIFNIGDSRAYRMDRAGFAQLSRDDNIGVRGRRTHIVTQSLGGTLNRQPLLPHIDETPLSPDATILLCSDGLTDMLGDREIAGILLRNSGDPAQRLVAAALDAGGRDNVTVVVVGPAHPDSASKMAP